MFKQYNQFWAKLSFGLFVLIIFMNVLIDPFDIFHFKGIQHLNLEKPELTKHYRAFTLREIRKIHPENVILGSSRAQIGLPAEGLKELGWTFFNAGLPQATMDEIYDYFWFAKQQTKLKKVLIAVDFFGFNAHLASLSPFGQHEKNYESYDPFPFSSKVAAVIGWSGLVGSIHTLSANWQNIRTQGVVEQVEKSRIPRQQLFAQNEQYYLTRKIYLPYPKKEYSLKAGQGKKSPMDFYQDLLTACDVEHIDCVVAILPTHARQMALIDKLGLWSQFEEWKRALVQITHRVSPAMRLYDFTGFHDIHQESIPLATASEQQMQFFVDGAHITLNLGLQILAFIYENKSLPEGFAMQLTPDTIESHLQQMAVQKQQYQKGHPDVVEWIDQQIKMFG